MEHWVVGVWEYWSNGKCKRRTPVLIQHSNTPTLHYSNTPFFFYHHSIVLYFHYPNTPLLHYSDLFYCSITPLLQYSNFFFDYSIFYIPRTWHTNVIMAVATIMLTMLVTTAEVAAYPTAEALLSHCIPRRHPERATRTPKTAL